MDPGAPAEKREMEVPPPRRGGGGGKGVRCGRYSAEPSLVIRMWAVGKMKGEKDDTKIFCLKNRARGGASDVYGGEE